MMMRNVRRLTSIPVAATLLLALGLPAGSGQAAPGSGVSPDNDAPGVVSRVSLGAGGEQPAGGGPALAGSPSVSADGNLVAFTSDATNLVAGDTNGNIDVFVFDRAAGTTTRVSVASGGAEAAGASFEPAISPDGNWVAFSSTADDLVANDTNKQTDVFLHDRANVLTTRVSVGQGAMEGNGPSGQPALSLNGGVVVFSSSATNLVANDTNGSGDVFMRKALTTVRVSAAGGVDPNPDGPSAFPDVSDNGAAITFSSEAGNLITSDANGTSDIFVFREAAVPAIAKVSIPDVGADTDGPSFLPSISGDGLWLAYASAASNIDVPDNGGFIDVFVAELGNLDNTRRASERLIPEQRTGNDDSLSPSISADGSLVAFSSDADNLVDADTNETSDVFVRNMSANTMTRASVGQGDVQTDGASDLPSLSDDATTVAFESESADLADPPLAGGGNIYVSRAGAVTRVSGPGGSGVADGPGGSDTPSVAAAGRLVAFASYAPNLVPGDTNRVRDVFVRDRSAGTTVRVSVGPGGEVDGNSQAPVLTPDGRFVVFESVATDLVPGDPNGTGPDIYRRDLTAGTTIRVSGPEPACDPAVSADGNIVAFTVVAEDCGDGSSRVAVKDLGTGTVSDVRAAGGSDGSGPDGSSRSPSLSADGRTMVFASEATNLVAADTNGQSDIFVWERAPGPGGAGGTSTVTRLVGSAGAQPDGASGEPSLSADGQTVAFTSEATNLVASDTNGEPDVFVTDRVSGVTTRVSLSTSGAQADGLSGEPALSADGQVVGFTSDALTFLPGPITRAFHVYRHDRRTGSTTGAAGDSSSAAPAVSADGAVIAFASGASDLVAEDTNGIDDIFVADLDPSAGDGYWLAAADGGVFSYGKADFHGSTGAVKLNSPIVGMSPSGRPGGGGYRFVAADGGVFAFGDATFKGSTGDIRLTKPVVGMASTPSGAGYWLVAADGGIFAFGDAAFKGSTGAIRLNRPVVGMAPTPSGKGYWLVATDGGIFAFGDAAFKGSTGAAALNSPIVGMAATPTGLGYWLVATDGGIFAFGDAGFFGSTGAVKLTSPVTGMARTPSGLGYWLVARDGGIFAFGDAAFAGSAAGVARNAPVVGIAAR